MELFRRPRSMPRFSRGRIFNRMSGGYAPSLYSGFRPRRAIHGRFQTQTSPYGAAGGGRRQYHAGHSGHAGNVYGAMMHHARRQGGVNMGLLPYMRGHTGSRTFKSFRIGKASAGQEAFRSSMGGKTRSDFKNAGEYRTARRQAKRAATQARRDFANTYTNPFGTTHKRARIRFARNPYTAQRSAFLTGFRGQRTLGTQNRHRRMTAQAARAPRVAQHADFTLGGRRKGLIGTGNHWNTGRNAGRVLGHGAFDRGNDWLARTNRRMYNREMTPYEKWRAQGRHAPHARDYSRKGGWFGGFRLHDTLDQFLRERFAMHD